MFSPPQMPVPSVWPLIGKTKARTISETGDSFTEVGEGGLEPEKRVGANGESERHARGTTN